MGSRAVPGSWLYVVASGLGVPTACKRAWRSPDGGAELPWVDNEVVLYGTTGSLRPWSVRSRDWFAQVNGIGATLRWLAWGYAAIGSAGAAWS